MKSKLLITVTLLMVIAITAYFNPKVIDIIDGFFGFLAAILIALVPVLFFNILINSKSGK